MRRAHITVLRGRKKQANTADGWTRASSAMTRGAWTAAVVAALLAVPFVATGSAAAADVDVVLIARGNDWHVGSPSAATKPTITVTPGDVMRLQVHNHDGTDHTFSFPRFG